MLNAEAGNADGGLSTGKADAAAKGKFILDPMVGSVPLYMDFTESWSGDDISLVDKLADVATTSTGGSSLLIAACGQVKIEAQSRYSGKR